MDVSFRRTGERRYAVVVSQPGREPQVMNPAPGFDEYIPHDLVHYVVEAELRFTSGVFGRAARGGGNFYFEGSTSASRERARQLRKQKKRERALDKGDALDGQLKESERLAYHSDIAWRRRHGQRPDPAFAGAIEPLSAQDRLRIERIVAQLERLAPAWHALPPEGELTFTWPSLDPQAR